LLLLSLLSWLLLFGLSWLSIVFNDHGLWLGSWLRGFFILLGGLLLLVLLWHSGLRLQIN
jgi:hypothetical protein